MGDNYGPIANQRTRGPLEIKLPNGKTKTLPGGAIFKAIHKSYIPKGHPFEGYLDSMYVVGYTQFGLALIPSYDIDWNVY